MSFALTLNLFFLRTNPRRVKLMTHERTPACNIRFAAMLADD
jgi:hypothetical protein